MGGRFKSVVYRYKDSDIWIAYDKNNNVNKEHLLAFVDEKCRSLWQIFEMHFKIDPGYEHALEPYSVKDNSGDEIKRLSNASLSTGVGPMAGIAGLFAEEIGRALKNEFGFKEIIVENGGDDYIDVQNDINVSLYAGEHPLSNKIHLIIEPEMCPIGLCASSGKFGHSISFGSADLVSIACRDTVLADQYATAFANRIKSEDDVTSVIQLAQTLPDILHIAVFKDQAFAIGGHLKVSQR
jgi:ApbE superfamily uncharacterized protein (UPF0280 family)